jgi:GAF domain-containing protein
MAAEIKSRSSWATGLGLTALSGWALLAAHQISEVLQRLTELTRTRLQADVVRVWLREGAAEEFRLHAQAGVTRQPGEYRMHLVAGEGLVGWITGRREPLVIEDLPGDPRLENRAWVETEGLRSFLGIPIVLADVPVGILACMYRERRRFSADDVALAQLLVLPAAAAIRNARLYEEARVRARELSERNRQLQLLH